MKLLCVLLPHFPLSCEIHRQRVMSGRPAAIIHEVGSQKLVMDFSPELGDLQCDMPLQQALSCYGEMELIQADIPYYWLIFNEILDRLEKKSPLVEGSELGQAYLGLDGLESLYGSDEALVNEVRAVIPPDFATRMGISDGKFLAYLAALKNSQGSHMNLTGNVNTFLSDLSCDVLPVTAKTKSKLHEFGIHTLGQLAALPLGPLQAQFGPEGKRMQELARGYDDAPLYPRSAYEIIEESVILSSVAVSIETITVAVESLLSHVFGRSNLRGRGIRSLTLWTQTWRAEHWEHRINFKEPAMDVRSTMPRIKQFLENYPQPGPVEELGIKLTRLGHSSKRQRSLFSEVRAQDHLNEDIKQLELRLGNPQVFKVKEVEPWSRIPERRYVLAPISH